ncbi:MAG: class I SAM-dependent methyltransferase [Blastocatellia bacterium]
MRELITLYEQKEASYFNNTGNDLAQLINGDNLKVLEVGCAAGGTGRMLLETGKAKWVTGIEYVPEYGEVARSVLSEVHIGNIEDMMFSWNAKHFDCFVFGDVLEHLSDPWSLLKRLRPFLADDGIAVASIPNVKHWSVISDLIFHDDWKYAESGVLDITHLRFFTRRTAARLFSETGYSVQSMMPGFNGRRYSIPNRFTMGIFAGFFAHRWLMRVRAA